MIENKEFEGEETNPKMLGKDLGKENFKETFRKIQVILEQLQKSEEEKDHADGLRIPRTSESTFISPLTSPRFGATYYASSQALKKSRSNLTLSSPTQKKFSLTRSRGNSVDKKLERANEDVEKKYWEERVRKITFEKDQRVKELERIISKLSREKQELAEKNLLYAKEIFAKKEELYQEAEQTIIHYQQQLEEEEEIHNIFSLEPEKVSSDQENLVSNHTLLDELEEAQKKLSEDDKLTTIKETLIANYRLDEKEREWLMSVEKNDWAKITQIIVDIQLKRFKQRIKGSFFTPCQKSETGLSSPASSSASFFSEPIIGTNPLTTTPGRITPVERRNSYFGGFFPEFSRISTNESTCSACGKIRFENENEDKQEELENLQRKNSELVRENRKLQKENRRLKSESGSFEIKNGELKKQVMEVGSKLESSSEGLKELSLEKIDKEIELKNLNEEKKKVEEEKAKVEEQLQKAEEKNSEEKNSKQELELERRNKIIIRQG
ncbi:5167_t:CDS:2, partial [Racocetra fulgida]